MRTTASLTAEIARAKARYRAAKPAYKNALASFDGHNPEQVIIASDALDVATNELATLVLAFLSAAGRRPSI